ncbi:GGDEF domain-containing protein [Christensenellaceae bacterium OttesenSCG-928-K19]|nr:GGDEF domain-containing protein [Christensenellaceae bacterium OttesenSCG-928-K19]
MDWTNNDNKYRQVKSKILLAALCIGLAATLVGGIYNATHGYTGWPVAIHIVGFVLLALLLGLFKKINKNVICALAFAYYCFAYTPFAWLSLGGLYSSVPYVVYVFFMLTFVLLDGRLGRFFTIAYMAVILVLVGFNLADPPVQNQLTPIFPLAFSYLVMLVVLVIVTGMYKRQFTALLHQNRQDSITDVLTGLHNHRHLTELLNEAEQWQKQSPEHDYAIAVIDLDDFKQVNDQYGHSTGDDVLQELGSILAETFRAHTVGRYGGDEFVAIFKDTPFEACIQICEMLRQQVSERLFTEQKIHISLSIGLCNRSQIEGQDLFAEADVLLYKAKEQNKNRVLFHEI